MSAARYIDLEASAILPAPAWAEDCQVQEADEPKPRLDWPDLVARIAAGEPSAITDFCRHFQPGIRFLILRHLGFQDADDRVHDVIVAVIQAIMSGRVRCPSRLPGFVRAVAKNQIHSAIRVRIRDRERQVEIGGCDLKDGRLSPEEAASQNERVTQMKNLLLALPALDREILTRFYIKGQSKVEICNELGLTPTQFRLKKSIAKGEITKAMRALAHR